MKTIFNFFFVFFLIFINIESNFSQSEKKKKKDKTKQEQEASKDKDLTKATVKPYKNVITKAAISKKGLIDVHQIEDKWFFEINDSLFNREIMTVTRYSKTVAGIGMYGGEEVNSQVIKWEKGQNNKVYLKSITYVSTSADSTKPIYTSVKNSNADPIIAVFDIKAIKKDTSVVIEVGEFFLGDNQTFSLNPYTKEMLKIKTFQKDKSYIEKISTYPINTEIKTFF